MKFSNFFEPKEENGPNTFNFLDHIRTQLNMIYNQNHIFFIIHTHQLQPFIHNQIFLKIVVYHRYIFNCWYFSHRF